MTSNWRKTQVKACYTCRKQTFSPRFGALTVVLMKIQVFCSMVLCRLIFYLSTFWRSLLPSSSGSKKSNSLTLQQQASLTHRLVYTVFMASFQKTWIVKFTVFGADGWTNRMLLLICLHIAFCLHKTFCTVFGLIVGKSRQSIIYATPWSNVYVEKLIVKHIKKLPRFGTERLITMFNSSSHWSVSGVRWIEPIPLYPV